VLALIGVVDSFWAVVALIVVWALMFAASGPIHSAYLNGLIPSQQRATILSFDSMIGSSGGVAFQPILGRSADVWGYAGSYVLGAGISALALPFVLLSRRQNAPADEAVGVPPEAPRAAVEDATGVPGLAPERS
jgi:MFS family permease